MACSVADGDSSTPRPHPVLTSIENRNI